MNHYVDGQSMLSIQKTNALKGILAICVLISHLYSIFHFENKILNWVVGSLMGYLSVSLFFFLSGYGLESSYEKKKDIYIEKFMKRKIIPFYTIYIILVGIYVGMRFIIGENISVSDIMKSLIYGGTEVKFGWFLQTILVLYLIFWISFQVNVCGGRGEKYKILLCTIGEIVFCIGSYVFEMDTTWYATSVCFLLGVYWKYFEKRIIKKMERLAVRIAFVGVCLCFAGIGILIANNLFSGRSSDMMQIMVTSIFFTIAFILIVVDINIENIITDRLGKISFEIYVLQGLFFILVEQLKIKSPVLSVLLICVGTIGLSVFVQPIFSRINEKVREYME